VPLRVKLPPPLAGFVVIEYVGTVGSTGGVNVNVVPLRLKLPPPLALAVVTV
jgi:hypothetical protein